GPITRPGGAPLPPPASPPRRRGRGWLFLLLALLAAGGVGYWIYQRPQATTVGRGGRRSGQGPPRAPPTVQSGDRNVPINALGTVTSLATVTVRSQISGQIMNIAFTEGQLVNKGDLLVEIDSRPYQLALAQAEGSLKQHQAMLQAAQLDLERYQNLVKTN